MSSFRHVLGVIEKVNFSLKWVGCSAEFDAEARRRFGELGQAIMAERGLRPEQLGTLDPDSKLKSRSQKLFDDLNSWLAEQPGLEILDKNIDIS